MRDGWQNDNAWGSKWRRERKEWGEGRAGMGSRERERKVKEHTDQTTETERQLTDRRTPSRDAAGNKTAA